MRRLASSPCSGVTKETARGPRHAVGVLAARRHREP
jgi:hypothetical protein